MPKPENRPAPPAGADADRPKLTPAAKRALDEAAARRARLDDALAGRIKEVGGPKRLEPARFGDWEKNGIAVDF